MKRIATLTSAATLLAGSEEAAALQTWDNSTVE